MFKNMGKRYGRLVAIELVSSVPHVYKCKCDCGTIKNISYLLLSRGEVKSCGCLRKETQTRGGLSSNIEYKSWLNMHMRVRKPKEKDIKTYKGVTICDRWHMSNPEGFSNFLKDMGKRLNRSMTLDRIDNNKGYSPDNCKWSTKKEQVLNRGMTKWIIIGDEKKCLKDWIRFLNIDGKTFYSYMSYHGISYEDTVLHYINKKGLNESL